MKASSDHSDGHQSAHGGAREQRKVAKMTTTPEPTRIQVHERGAADDPLAVLIHSTGVNGAEMLDGFGLAVPGYHVLAPDRTNYGQSRRSTAGGRGRSNGHVPEVAMIEDDAQEIGSFLGSGAHLVGYSYGGVVAVAVASRQPGLVRSLTLIEPPAFQLLPDDPNAASTVARISSSIDTVYDNPSGYFAAFMSSAFGETFRVPLDAIPTDRKVASMCEQVPWDVELDLDRIADARIPTLVVSGDWDPGFVAVSRHLAKALSGRVIEYAGASHFFDERWNDIANELERFWRAVDEE
ncbi:MAG: hypothetical protein DLM58_05075 [Pseudonocardiales bacterium]|nr:MAG: hypothetical protein DLM58_05075 [Pseudonocardiales bacterium]